MLIAAATLIAGCATEEAPVKSYTDQVSGLTTGLMDNELEAAGAPREIVKLNATRYPKNFNQILYYLEVDYMALKEVGYLEIPPGRTLTLMVDGQPTYFDGTGSGNMRKPYKLNKQEFAHEVAIYQTTKAQLRKIAEAKTVLVRIKGNNGLIEREFNQVNHDRFVKFVRTFAQ
jgi:hypothetical protein